MGKNLLRVKKTSKERNWELKNKEKINRVSFIYFSTNFLSLFCFEKKKNRDRKLRVA